MCQMCSSSKKILGLGFHLFIWIRSNGGVRITTWPLSVLGGWIFPSSAVFLFHHCTSSPPYSACLSKAIMNACSTPPHDSPWSRFCQSVILSQSLRAETVSDALVITWNDTNVLCACIVPPNLTDTETLCLQTSAVRMRRRILAYGENLPSAGWNKYNICIVVGGKILNCV